MLGNAIVGALMTPTVGAGAVVTIAVVGGVMTPTVGVGATVETDHSVLSSAIAASQST